MTANELNELAGRIEGLGRVVLHLVARMEDAGFIDGQQFTDALRGSIVPSDARNRLMVSAQQTLDRVTRSIDDARDWRRFRRQAVTPARAKRKAR